MKNNIFTDKRRSNTYRYIDNEIIHRPIGCIFNFNTPKEETIKNTSNKGAYILSSLEKI